MLAAGVILGYSGRAWTQTDPKLPMPGYNEAKDIAGAKELPDPAVDYKVVFSVAANAKADEIHPTLKTIALDLNTLAHNGVPPGHRHIAAVFHQGGGDAVLANDVYKSRHDGADKGAGPDQLLEARLERRRIDRRGDHRPDPCMAHLPDLPDLFGCIIVGERDLIAVARRLGREPVAQRPIHHLRRDDVVAWLDAGYPGPDLFDRARALVAEDHWQLGPAHRAIHDVQTAVAHAAGRQAHEDFP